jgi:site-specific recombinase XerD
MSTSVKLKFRPSKIIGKEGVILIQLIHSRKVKLISTFCRIFPEEWDWRNEIIILNIADCERFNELQSRKSRLDAELRTIHDLICLFEKRNNYTVDELSDLYTSNSFNGNLFPFIDYITKALKEKCREKTASIFTTVKMSFLRFRSGQDILINNIDNELIMKYENYLKTIGLKKNTASCYLRALRSIYNQAVGKGLSSQKSPFKGVYTGIDKTVKRAINEDIIIRLKNMDLSANMALGIARDLFMFSFYMRGMSFVDMANLKKSDVKNGYIVYFRSKTKQSITVRMEDCMRKIIAGYSKQTIKDYLLPIYTEPDIDYMNCLRTYNKRLKRISEMLGLEKSLSSYVARHSWATLALRKGIPVEVISESMGHENETTTRIYLASLGQSVVDKANAEIIRLKK